MKALLLCLCAMTAGAATLQVGPARQFRSWCDAVARAHDGDTIEVDGGNTYLDQTCVVRQTNLTIKGVGWPRPIFRNAYTATSQGKATLVAEGANLTVDGIEFYGPSGAADNCIDSGNGKGYCAGSLNAVRIQGSGNKGFTMRNCYVHHVEMGILSAMDLPRDAEILIEHSEFADNCVSEWVPGYVHSLYINAVGKFTFRYNYAHRCNGGILVKSRAAENWIVYNRITDEGTGRRLYFPAGYPPGGAGVPPSCTPRLSQGLDCSFDMGSHDCNGTGGWCYSGANNAVQCANGGHCYIIGNLIQQGPHSGNPTIVKYADEGNQQPGSDLYFINNTVVNEQKGKSGAMITVGYPGKAVVDVPAKVWNNVFYTPGSSSGWMVCGQNSSRGPAPCSDLAGNINTSVDPFVDRANYDYRLKRGSPAINAGLNPGVSASGADLAPELQYAHPAGAVARIPTGALDAGAYEYAAVGTAPAIGTKELPAGAAGSPYSFQLAGTGDAPLTWMAKGLPTWATLDSSGLLKGTPDRTASITIRVIAANAAGMDAKDVVLTVEGNGKTRKAALGPPLPR